MEGAAAEVHAILQGARPPRGSGPTYLAPAARAGAAHAGPPDMRPGGAAGAAGASHPAKCSVLFSKVLSGRGFR